MNLSKGYVLWLPSWYPNKFEPFNGDFVQRHAAATALFCNITVCHFPQLGHSVEVDNVPPEEKVNGRLKEVVFYISFRPLGIKFLDRIRYNFQYYRSVFKYLKGYFNLHGLPTLVHVHVPVKAGIIALWIKKRFGISYIVSEHSALYLTGARDSFSQRSFAYRSQVRSVFRKALEVTNVSNALGKLLMQKFHLREVITVHNTVDTNLFYYLKSNNDVFKFIHVSSLTYQKNIEGIINVFAQYKNFRADWKLQLVGPWTKQLLDQIHSVGLENYIELKGEVSYIQVAEYMRQANAFVLFSRYENFPCVVIEALCCGLPVVAPDVAGIKEAVNSTNGILVESENEVALLNAVAEAQNKYHRFDREAIFKRASALYNFNEVGSQFFNLYCTLYGK